MKKILLVDDDRDLQTLVRVTRHADGRLEREDLGDVRFVPLIGGVDLSPLVLIVVAQALLMVLESLLSTVLRLL